MQKWQLRLKLGLSLKLFAKTEVNLSFGLKPDLGLDYALV